MSESKAHISEGDDFAIFRDKSLGDDFDELLTIARDLRNRVDRRRRLVDAYTMVGGAFVFLSFVGGYWIKSQELRQWDAWLFGGLVYIVLALAMFGWTIIRVRRQIERDRHALNRVIKIIGELLAAASVGEKWGPVRRAKYEIAIATLAE
jgi:hypothetical protein